MLLQSYLNMPLICAYVTLCGGLTQVPQQPPGTGLVVYMYNGKKTCLKALLLLKLGRLTILQEVSHGMQRSTKTDGKSLCCSAISGFQDKNMQCYGQCCSATLLLGHQGHAVQEMNVYLPVMAGKHPEKKPSAGTTPH